MQDTLKVVEFFSGIGGWHRALDTLEICNFDVIAAFDVNVHANETYALNYGNTPNKVHNDMLGMH